jgi:hypothetical protein
MHAALLDGTEVLLIRRLGRLVWSDPARLSVPGRRACLVSTRPDRFGPAAVNNCCHRRSNRRPTASSRTLGSATGAGHSRWLAPCCGGDRAAWAGVVAVLRCCTGMRFRKLPSTGMINCYAGLMTNSDNESVASGPDFDWQQAGWGPLYPPSEILAEVGRVTIAAARVDRQLALVLLAVKHSNEFEELLKMNSSNLCSALMDKLNVLFEGDLHSWARSNLTQVQKMIEARHSVAHSIWTPSQESELFSVQLLVGIESQQQIDELLLKRGASAVWTTLHPKKGGPGPQTLVELETVRANLEAAAEWLEQLRFTLASALFAGKPPGARRVLDPYGGRS